MQLNDCPWVEGVILCLHLHFCLRPITSPNNDIPFSLFGTLSTRSVSPLFSNPKATQLLFTEGVLLCICLYLLFLFKSINQPEQGHTNLPLWHLMLVCLSPPLFKHQSNSTAIFEVILCNHLYLLFVTIPIPAWTISYQPIMVPYLLCLHLCFCSNPKWTQVQFRSIWGWGNSVSISIF